MGVTKVTGEPKFGCIADNSSILNFDYNNPWSMVGWVSCQTNDTYTFFHKFTTNRGYEIQSRLDTGEIRVRISNGNTNRIILSSTDSSVRGGSLHHLAFTYSGSGVASGVQVFEDLRALTLTTDQDNLNNGSITTSQIFRLGGNNGIFADMRVYNRVISQSEMETMFYARGADNITSGLLARWLLDELPEGTIASGTNLFRDVSGSGFHLSPVLSTNSVYVAVPVRLVSPIFVQDGLY